MKEIYLKSLEGILVEIKRKQAVLRSLKSWYLTAKSNRNCSYTGASFYRIGIKCKSDIRRLRIISNEMFVLMKNLTE